MLQMADLVLAKEDHLFQHRYRYDKYGQKTKLNAYFQLKPAAFDTRVTTAISGSKFVLKVGNVVGLLQKELKVKIGKNLPRDYANYIRSACGTDEVCALPCHVVPLLAAAAPHSRRCRIDILLSRLCACVYTRWQRNASKKQGVRLIPWSRSTPMVKIATQSSLGLSTEDCRLRR